MNLPLVHILLNRVGGAGCVWNAIGSGPEFPLGSGL